MFSTDGLKPCGNRRAVYVSDPSSVASRYLPDPVREEDLRRWIDAIPAAEIDTFVFRRSILRDGRSTGAEIPLNTTLDHSTLVPAPARFRCTAFAGLHRSMSPPWN